MYTVNTKEATYTNGAVTTNATRWEVEGYALLKKDITHTDGSSFTVWSVDNPADKPQIINTDDSNLTLAVGYEWAGGRTNDAEGVAEMINLMTTATGIGAVFQEIYEAN